MLRPTVIGTAATHISVEHDRGGAYVISHLRNTSSTVAASSSAALLPDSHNAPSSDWRFIPESSPLLAWTQQCLWPTRSADKVVRSRRGASSSSMSALRNRFVPRSSNDSSPTHKAVGVRHCGSGTRPARWCVAAATVGVRRRRRRML